MAYARPEKARVYRDHLSGVVLPKLRKLPGFLGLELCEASRGDQVELLVVSRWQSMEAINAFAGPNPDRAVVDPGAKAVLAEYDDFVTHYEVTLEAMGA
jgi:heme-degrading monooxygenase HmoA